MARWDEIVVSEPEFAARVRRLFDAHKHKTMATLRRDGSPRISGTEVEFLDGDLWIGSMPGAVKALDLRRDPRMALHSGSDDPPEDESIAWAGDAKVAGRAVEVIEPAELERFWRAHRQPPQPGGAHIFRIDLTEVVQTRVEPPALVIESWHPGVGLRRRERT